jgi:pimeloyl-ACP methyl ester carboxylesterase
VTGTLHTEVHGDPAHPTLILLHGGGATAVVVPHTGHLLPVTQARAFNAIVSGFLAEPRRPA